MAMLTARTYILALLLSLSSASAQFTDSLFARRPSSFEGFHFLVGYMQNENYIQSSGIRLRLILATALPAQVTVQYPNGSATPYSLKANSTLTIIVPSNFEVRESEKNVRSLVEVNSDVPIAVYAMSSQYTTSDSYAVIPISNWGSAYTVLSMPNDAYSVGTDSLGVPPSEIRQSEFLVMAAYDNTVVDFKPAAQTELGRPAGQWHTVTLQRGESFLVKSAPIRPLSGDLTGTFVKSSRPIAVLSGHSRTSVPQALVGTQDSKDHLAEWLMPDNVLGTQYISTPFFTNARIPVGDVIRIVATQPNTHISLATERADLNYTLVNAGDVQTIPGMSSPGWFNSDKPISIGQYMLTGYVGGSSLYDPSLSIVPPVDKFITRCIFQTPFNIADPAFAAQFQMHYVNVVCDSIARYSIKLDGVNIGQKIAPEILTQKFRSSPFFWTQIQIQPGKHELSCDSGAFSGTLYGMGPTDSYANTLGFSTTLGVKDVDAPEFSVTENCGTLNGVAREVINNFSTSIAYVVYDADSTINYTFTAKDVQIDPDNVQFTAVPTNPFKDAQIHIIVRDKAGNGRRYRYYYHAPRFTQSTSLTFVAKTENDSICQRMFIQSPYSTDSITIRSVRLARNSSSLNVYAPSGYPILVRPKTGVDFSVCFTPKGLSSLKVEDTVLVDIGCGLIVRIPIRATTPTSSIRVDDVDFGDVMVGDTVCKIMTIVNNGTRIATLTNALLNFPTPVFSDNHTTMLPKSLNPGDTLRLRICFMPSDTFDLRRLMIFENSLGVDVQGEIHAHGIRAIPLTDDVDFGRRRIATFIDTTVVIHNLGNVALPIQYQSQSGQGTVFLHSTQVGHLYTIGIRDSLSIPLRFYPQTTGTFTSALVFTTVQGTAKQVTINLRGVGTVPVDSVCNVWFDTITVAHIKTLSPVCLISKGSETLTIDTIVVAGQDPGSFRFKLSQFGYQQVKVGDSLKLDVEFRPMRTGRHRAQLVVTHDADRAFFRKQSIINIEGWARDTVPGDTTKPQPTSHDTLAPVLNVIVNTKPYACDVLPYIVTVRNRDTIALDLQSYTVMNTVSLDTIYRGVRATRLAPLARDTIRGVWAAPLHNGVMSVHLKCGKWSVDTVIAITPVKAVLTAGIATTPVVKPKDSLLVTFGGTFTSYSKVPEFFELHSTIPTSMYDCTVSTAMMQFGAVHAPIPVSIVHSGSEITLRSLVAFQVDNTCLWSIQVPLVALFAEQQMARVQTHVQSMTCYDIQDSETEMGIASVCAEDVRHFYLSGVEFRQVFPQPAGDFIELKLRSFSETEFINVAIIDVLGRKFPLAENLSLWKGDNSCIFDLSSFPNGYYRLELLSRDNVKQLPIMLTK